MSVCACVCVCVCECVCVCVCARACVCVGGREGERERQRQRQRQTESDRQRHRQTDRQRLVRIYLSSVCTTCAKIVAHVKDPISHFSITGTHRFRIMAYSMNRLHQNTDSSRRAGAGALLSDSVMTTGYLVETRVISATVH